MIQEYDAPTCCEGSMNLKNVMGHLVPRFFSFQCGLCGKITICSSKDLDVNVLESEQ